MYSQPAGKHMQQKRQLWSAGCHVAGGRPGSTNRLRRFVCTAQDTSYYAQLTHRFGVLCAESVYQAAPGHQVVGKRGALLRGEAWEGGRGRQKPMHWERGSGPQQVIVAFRLHAGLAAQAASTCRVWGSRGLQPPHAAAAAAAAAAASWRLPPTRRLEVALGVVDVDFCWCHIQVAGEHHWLALLQALQVCRKLCSGVGRGEHGGEGGSE